MIKRSRLLALGGDGLPNRFLLAEGTIQSVKPASTQSRGTADQADSVSHKLLPKSNNLWLTNFSPLKARPSHLASERCCCHASPSALGTSVQELKGKLSKGLEVPAQEIDRFSKKRPPKSYSLRTMALSASGQLNRSRKKVSAVPAKVRTIFSISLIVRAFQKYSSIQN